MSKAFGVRATISSPRSSLRSLGSRRGRLGQTSRRPANPPQAEAFFEPNLYIYDAYPGGIGISEPLYRACDTLLNGTLELINACPCENGCPSCVGPTADRGERTKEVALEILGRVCRGAKFESTRTAETA